MVLELFALAALSGAPVPARERCGNVEVERPAGWERHEAGGVVRLAPPGVAQPYGVTFLSPERDASPAAWLDAVIAGKRLECSHSLGTGAHCRRRVLTLPNGRAVVVSLVVIVDASGLLNPILATHSPQVPEAAVEALLRSARPSEKPRVPEELGPPLLASPPLGAVGLAVPPFVPVIAGRWTGDGAEPTDGLWFFPSGRYVLSVGRTSEEGTWKLEGDVVAVNAERFLPRDAGGELGPRRWKVTPGFGPRGVEALWLVSTGAHRALRFTRGRE